MTMKDEMSVDNSKKLVEEEVSLIANYFRKMGKKQVAKAIENGDYKNERA